MLGKWSGSLIGIILGGNICYAAELTVTMYTTGGKKPLGQVTFTDSQYGLLIKPNLVGLPGGLHGFHIHEHPNCGEEGHDAGGHFDPQKTNTHQGPYGDGHLGDLPVLYVTKEGGANIPTLAPRLKTSDLPGHAVIIHEGGDTYSDTPKLGGGGERIACGIIEQTN
ncbi:superoxide dismutase family protein [Legionella londiniensis]|uniref:Superoxide dismutase [Cu-Zn] n=1 Tax=Legionella londiniensis TaxID=45068 RepID=A0A0W0VST9_9GAMM|nr:superoxide dismutase family protein [Legionella londiniensis]KTD23187.1 superoxide dismutase, Cu, Zn [Legionella londiniensis]STX93802.1 superoxide dismutase, Cu, Zn [Legionella londiniensis]